MPENVLSDDWVKTKNGCEFLTSHTDASNVTWDGECLYGKVHGAGKLVIYKNDQLFYELTGVYENGKPRKGEINWADDDNYANYVWLKNNLDKQQTIGKFKSKGMTYIGEVFGFDRAYQLIIDPDGSYKCGIVNSENLLTDLLSITEFENYFKKNYSKNEFEHFIPVKLPKKTIAITYFDNTSEDRSYDPLIKGLADMLISDLSSIESVKMVEREKLDAILKEIDLGESQFIDDATAQKIGKGLGAQYILTGSFIIMGDAFRIDARLVDVGNGEIVFSKAVDGNKETFFAIEKELAKEIISNLELSVSNQWLSAMEESGTTSFAAYANWSTGNKFFTASKYDSAIIHYKKSLEFDPGFKLPIAHIVAAYDLYLNMLYPDYLQKIDNEDWISSKIDNITIFNEFYEFFISHKLPNQYRVSGTEFNISEEEYNIRKSTLCLVIMKYYCNSSKYVNDSLECSEIDMANAYLWAERAYNNHISYRTSYYYGWYLFRYNDDPKTALDLYMNAVELDSTWSPSYRGILEIMIHYQNNKGIIKYGEKYLSLAPNDQAVYIHVGIAYHNLENYEKAIEYYKDYKSIGYGTSNIYGRIGLCYWAIGDYKMAAEYFSADDKYLIPENLFVNYEYLVYCYYNLKSYQKAYDSNKRYIQYGIENNLISDESLMYSYCNQSELAKLLNEYDNMYANLDLAKSLNSQYWLVRNNLCEYYMITKEYDKALEEIEHAIRLAPELPGAHDTMGDLQVEMGNYDEAIDHYLRAIEKDSTFSDGYLHIALVYEKQSKKNHIEYYTKAANLENEDAKIWVKKNKKLIDEHNNKGKAAPAGDYIEELKKLAELKSLGIITEEEFEAKKKELLGL
jgi:tetratricopeptide (TPR) repeat protein